MPSSVSSNRKPFGNQLHLRSPSLGKLGGGDLFEICATGKAIFDLLIKSQTFTLSLTSVCANIQAGWLTEILSKNSR